MKYKLSDIIMTIITKCLALAFVIIVPFTIYKTSGLEQSQKRYQKNKEYYNQHKTEYISEYKKILKLAPESETEIDGKIFKVTEVKYIPKRAFNKQNEWNITLKSSDMTLYIKASGNLNENYKDLDARIAFTAYQKDKKCRTEVNFYNLTLTKDKMDGTEPKQYYPEDGVKVLGDIFIETMNKNIDTSCNNLNIKNIDYERR